MKMKQLERLIRMRHGDNVADRVMMCLVYAIANYTYTSAEFQVLVEMVVAECVAGTKT